MSLATRHDVNTVGSGERTMLFSHGFGCHQGMFRFMVDALKTDYRCILYDLAGAGNYDMDHWRPERYRTLHGYAADLNALLDELAPGEVIFVGHSVSAMVGVLAANARPEQFSALVLIGPSPRYINDADGYFGGFEEADIDELLDTLAGNYLGWSSGIAPAIVGNPERPALGQELTNSFCKTNPAAARHFATVTFKSDNRADLADVRHPTLVLQCGEDIIASERVGEYVRDHIPGSHYVVLDARGHCPNLSEPAKTVAAVRRFLDEITVPA